MNSTSPLLLIGYRRAVLPALRRLARPAFALVGAGDVTPSSAELAGIREVDLHGAADAIATTARELLGASRPAAVVALAERTVVVAARLRAAFGLEGNLEETALRCADKVVMKHAMEAAGVPVARWRPVDGEASARSLVADLGLPIVVKPRRDSGGRGQRLARSEPELAAVLGALPAISTGWLAERWIDGIEMSVESFVAGHRVRFANPTEYFVPRHASILPAVLDEATRRAVLELNGSALRAAGIERGITHLELFRTSGGPLFGELAARPPGGRLMPLIQRAWGFDPWEALLRLELGEGFSFPARARRAAGAYVLHPGEGRVRHVRGLEDTRALPHVRRVSLRVAPGDVVRRREGSGQDVGAILVEGPDRDVVAAALTRARETLRIEVDRVSA